MQSLKVMTGTLPSKEVMTRILPSLEVTNVRASEYDISIVMPFAVVTIGTPTSMPTENAGN
jgi:hypothetical protein